MSDDTDMGMLDRTRKNMADRKANIAQRLRDLADEVDRISFTNHKGAQRPPARVLGEVVHTVQWGFANLPMQALAGWVEDIYEIEKEAAKQ